MAAKARTATHSVEYQRELEQKPYGRHLFQVLRHLESLFDDRPRFGTSLRAQDDPVRLRQEPALTFAPSTIESFRPGRDGGRAELSIRNFGVFGPNGPLPLHLTEYARNRRRDGDHAFVDFVDIFHHRLIGLFYRAWADAQPTVQLDRPDENRFGLYVGALAGLALEMSRRASPLPDEIRLHYVGHLSCPTRHADGLRSIVSDYFEVPVEIEEFVGHRISLPEQCRCRLGESPRTGTLGRSLTVGSSFWQRQDRFRIVIGPLAERDYRRMLPPSESVDRLVELVRSHTGDEFSWEVKLILKKEAVRPYQVGGRAQLGLNSWLISRPLEQDPQDFVMEPCARGERPGRAAQTN